MWIGSKPRPFQIVYYNYKKQRRWIVSKDLVRWFVSDSVRVFFPRILAAARGCLECRKKSTSEDAGLLWRHFKGGSADVCQFGFVFPCVHLPSVHVPACAGPCHIPTKH